MKRSEIDRNRRVPIKWFTLTTYSKYATPEEIEAAEKIRKLNDILLNLSYAKNR